MMKRWIFVLPVVLAAAFLQAQTNTTRPSKKTDRLTELFGDPVIVKGKGIEITRNQLDEEIIRRKEMLLASSAPVPPEVDKQVLDALIAAKLLVTHATEADRTKAKTSSTSTWRL